VKGAIYTAVCVDDSMVRVRVPSIVLYVHVYMCR
jgi:hypothetical protein